MVNMGAVFRTNDAAQFDYVYDEPGIVLNFHDTALLEQNASSSRMISAVSLDLPRFVFGGTALARYVHSAGTCIVNGEFRIGHGSANSNLRGDYTLSGTGSLSVGDHLIVVRNGTFTQSGGVCTARGARFGDSFSARTGRLILSEGTLSLGPVLAMDFGSATITGGRASAGILDIDGWGTVTLSGGTLSVGTVDLGWFGSATGSITINGGALEVANDLNIGTATFVNYNAGSLSCGMMRIALASSFTMGLGPNKVARMTGISIDSLGKMDVGNAAAVVDYDGASPISTIRAYITSGYAGGSWNGNGIHSAFAAVNPAYAVGYAEASALGAVPAMFGAVDSTTVLIRATRYGDADLSGSINLADFNRLASNFGLNVGAVWSQGDFNFDGRVNLSDFNLLAGNFGLSAGPDGPTPQDWAALAAAVPEPLGVAWVLPGFAMLHRRRQRGLTAPPLC
jgi:hypothetical protein